MLVSLRVTIKIKLQRTILVESISSFIYMLWGIPGDASPNTGDFRRGDAQKNHLPKWYVPKSGVLPGLHYTTPPYCWWKKSCTSWEVVYPIIYMVLYIPGGAGFLPSTVPGPSKKNIRQQSTTCFCRGAMAASKSSKPIRSSPSASNMPDFNRGISRLHLL